MLHQKSDTALLVMDMQDMLLQNLEGSDQLKLRIAGVIAWARQSGIPVIYVAVGFRSGFPEIHPEHRFFGPFTARAAGMNMEQMMKIADEVAPAEGEVVVTKKRFSAFTGSDLEVVLRANGIRNLVLSGVVTSGVVLATFMEAADKDYNLTVLSDGCMDRKPEVHQMLMDTVFARIAEIKTCEEWAQP